MYLDNEDFLSWMEKLLKKLTIIGSDLKAMMATGEAFNNEDKLLDNQDLAFLLKVSYRTLQRYRDSGQLRYSLVRRKTFYRMADVKEFIQSYYLTEEVVMRLHKSQCILMTKEASIVTILVAEGKYRHIETLLLAPPNVNLTSIQSNSQDSPRR